MRMDLKVPFAEKDEAKKLGARWDPARKTWYVVNQTDLAPFARWSPQPHDGTSTAPPASPRAKSTAASQVIVGSRYKPLPKVCECLPWEECEKCRALLQ